MSKQELDVAVDMVTYTAKHFAELDIDSRVIYVSCIMAFAEMIKPLYIELKKINGESSNIVYKFE